MKKIYYIATMLGCISILFTSCLDDLNTEPLTSNILLPGKAWEDPNSYEQFTSKIYAGFALSGNEGPAGQSDISASDQGVATFIRTYWNLQQLPTDEVAGAWDNETLRRLQFCQWNSSNEYCLLNYNRIYMNIAYANEFMRETTDAKLDARKVDESLRKDIATFRAEVKALRALNYYFLMDLYGNIPYMPDDVEVGVGKYLPEQKDRKFFFTWIESELKSVEGKLPANNRANYGKVNDPTVWMILSKLYLNAEVYIGEKKYTECLTYLNKILSAGYVIEPTYKHMFGADNDKSTEIIFPYRIRW